MTAYLDLIAGFPKRQSIRSALVLSTTAYDLALGSHFPQPGPPFPTAYCLLPIA
jgi:hypothetical protein